jgi:DNA-binding MarR family transcriptional regulator
VDSADRRSVRLTLTPTGRERIATINDLCNRHYEALLGEMRETDQRSVVQAVRLLAESMRRLRARQQVQGSCCGTAKELRNE